MHSVITMLTRLSLTLATIIHFTTHILFLHNVTTELQNTVCPTRYRTRLAGGPLLRVATIRRSTDTFLFISHTTNVLLFKFRCNIFIGVRIIKEMPGSVASGTHCIKLYYYLTTLSAFQRVQSWATGREIKWVMEDITPTATVTYPCNDN